MSRNVKSKQDLAPLEAYELIQEEQIPELQSLGLIFRHKKSGARVIVLSNDDENKVFAIGFRTPPEDSTGVAHIVEHTVLCGSDKFPVKDPFVELVKGSLNTFLNAMTYSDKTIYPVASLNDKDFQNLVHVYMDAVFHPNIYKHEEIFKQEGWHYELEKEEDDITYNGVVYNEMKGVFSSPEQQLYRLIQNSLFPDTTYGIESGGDPECIPDLSYEDFLNFHKRYYHPSNSYIYLYGNVDVEEKLNWMDKEYLSHYGYESVDSKIQMQPAFDEMKEVKQYYSVTESESKEEKTYLSYNTVIGTSLDRKLYLAFQVLEYALLNAPGAPLKQALIKENIGKDVMGSYDNGILQPIFSIIAKNTEEDKKDDFIRVIRSTLEKIVADGMNDKALLAAINYFEFKYREADFGNYPKGLMYGIQILDSWLYDDAKPFIHIRANDTFAFLKEQVGKGYFESLIKQYLLENHHSSLVIVKPMEGLTNIMEENVKEQLADYKASLSKNQITQLIEDTKALKKYQDTPSSKEELELIPMLKREDIEKKAPGLCNDLKMVDDVKVLHHNIYTNGISYIKFLFDVDDVEEELVPYMSLLMSVLGYIDSKQHTFMEFSNEVNIHTGGVATDLNLYPTAFKPDQSTIKFEVKTKALHKEVPKALELMKELMFDAKLDDVDRLQEIISELYSRLDMKLNSSSHAVAITRAMSYYSQNGLFNEMIGGISYFRFIGGLNEHFEEKKDEIVANLKKVYTAIFQKNRLLVSYIADEEGYEQFVPSLKQFLPALYTDGARKEKLILHPFKKNEGFKTSGQVQYVGRAGNFINAGCNYNGALKILKVALSYDYFWINIRVKGGAYGCMSGFTFDGNGYFVSYRDPSLKATDEVYAKTEDYVKNFDVDERDMTKYIIGAISSMDTPLNPLAKGNRSLSAYLTGVTEEDIQKERDQVINATQEDMRALEPIVKAVYEADNLCVIGNENKIEEDKQLFMNIENLK